MAAPGHKGPGNRPAHPAPFLSPPFCLGLSLSLFLLLPKVFGNVCLALVSGPAGRGPLPQDVFHIQACTAFHQKANDFGATSTGGMVQRSRVGMTRAVAVGIFARVKQHAHDFDVAKLCRQCKCELTGLIPRVGKQPASILGPTQSRRYRQVDARATREESAQGLPLTVQGSSVQRGAGVRSVLAEEVD